MLVSLPTSNTRRRRCLAKNSLRTFDVGRRPSLFFFSIRALSLSLLLQLRILTFSPFLGVGATLSSGATVAEGVDARATTEEEEETRRGADAAASLADDELREAGAEEAARGTTTAVLLLLVAASRRQATEREEEEDASVVCILFGRKGGESNEKEKERERTSEADLGFFLSFA